MNTCAGAGETRPWAPKGTCAMDRRLLVDGRWWCAVHAPEGRGLRHSCSHHLAQPGQPCPWCGERMENR